MRLYLRPDLFKSENNNKQKAGAEKPVDAKSASSKQGQQKGGTYVARIQLGYEKDGSPKYRYFRTEEEYEAYLHGKGKSKAAQDLEDKVKKEHETSKEKTTGHVNPGEDKDSKKRSMFSKSLRLYVKG